jgi:hypothetical protein
VRGGTPPVQQTSFSQHMCAQAKADDPGAPRMCVAERLQQRFWYVFVHVAPAGHDDRVGLLQHGQRSEIPETEAGVCAHRTGLCGTHDHFEEAVV